MDSNCIANADIDTNVSLQIAMLIFLKFETEGNLCLGSSFLKYFYIVLLLANISSGMFIIVIGVAFLTTYYIYGLFWRF
jgi:hypothetical protein